jgi:hypothetical protein
MIKDAVVALDDPTYRLSRRLLRKRVGPSALSELRRAARADKNPRIAARAARLAAELSKMARRRR